MFLSTTLHSVSCPNTNLSQTIFENFIKFSSSPKSSSKRFKLKHERMKISDFSKCPRTHNSYLLLLPFLLHSRTIIIFYVRLNTRKQECICIYMYLRLSHICQRILLYHYTCSAISSITIPVCSLTGNTKNILSEI